MSELAQRECLPCRGGIPPLGEDEAAGLLAQLGSEWRLVERADLKHGTVRILSRSYRFKDFAAAMRAALTIAELAEHQQHHPDLHVSWGRLGIDVWTHKIGGLTESDFVFAAKCEDLELAASPQGPP